MRRSGHRWAIDVPAVVDLVIPGLRVSRGVGRGSIDAVAAAAHAMSREVSVPMYVPLIASGLDSLRPYQREGVARIVEILKQNGGAILADDMGLGKTRQAITVARLLVGGGRVIVLCPASVRETWRKEVGGSSALAILGPPSSPHYKSDWDIAPHASIIVTSYELADRAFDAAFPNTAPTIMILDEAHMLRGRDAKRAKKALNIARLTPYRLALTGTPMWDRPRDLYKLLDLLHGSQTWGTWHSFDSRYCAGKFDQWGGWDNRGLTNADELRLRLSYYMVRRTKAEVAAELPKFVRQTLWIEPVPKAVQAFQAAMVRRAPGDTYQALRATLEGKMDACIELAAQAGKFLLLTWLKEHARHMHERLPNSLLITGDIPHQERQARIDAARRDGLGIVATIDSVGTGVDGLQHVASVGITHAIDFVPIKLMQAEARLDRIGQANPITWYYVAMRETMDQMVVEQVVEKLKQSVAVIGEGEALAANLTAGTLQDEEAALSALYASMSDG